MSDQLDPLILDLLEWLAAAPRAYGEVMETWRTSCPRLTAWEDALDRRLVERRRREGGAPMVAVTSLGGQFLRERGRGGRPGAGTATGKEPDAAERSSCL
ncbi:MAG TPA: hypothetical protein VII73_03155 [Caulobacteraceae bacterium]